MKPDQGSTKSPIRFIYFDLGNILFEFDRAIACANVTALMGGTMEFADEVLHDSGLQVLLETGRLTDEAFAAAVHERYVDWDSRAADGGPARVPVRAADLSLAISDMFTPVESMADVVAAVRSMGYPIGILSNTCDAHWTFLRNAQHRIWRTVFDIEVVSYRAGSMKPDPAIYEIAESHAHVVCGARPEQILFLDDRQENVDAATARGWNAEVCWGGEKAVAALVKHQIEVPRPS